MITVLLRYFFIIIGFHIGVWLLYDFAPVIINAGFPFLGWLVTLLTSLALIVFWIYVLYRVIKAFRVWRYTQNVDSLSYLYCLRKNISLPQAKQAQLLLSESKDTPFLTLKDFISNTEERQ